jgi:hypothetical protein
MFKESALLVKHDKILKKVKKLQKGEKNSNSELLCETPLKIFPSFVKSSSEK